MEPNLEKPNTTEAVKCNHCGGTGEVYESGEMGYCGCDAGKRKQEFFRKNPARVPPEKVGINFDRDHLFPTEERPGGKRSTPPEPDNNDRSAFDQNKNLGTQLDLFD
ncbi:MAG TPA: hypothetical protein VJB09_00740 [Candidatus Paceibacterota bacterium]